MNKSVLLRPEHFLGRIISVHFPLCSHLLFLEIRLHSWLFQLFVSSFLVLLDLLSESLCFGRYVLVNFLRLISVLLRLLELVHKLLGSLEVLYFITVDLEVGEMVWDRVYNYDSWMIDCFCTIFDHWCIDWRHPSQFRVWHSLITFLHILWNWTEINSPMVILIDDEFPWFDIWYSVFPLHVLFWN